MGIMNYPSKGFMIFSFSTYKYDTILLYGAFITWTRINNIVLGI
jgi:hypothetical protein